eukprot:5099469-Prymnesium_polylepis.1
MSLDFTAPSSVLHSFGPAAGLVDGALQLTAADFLQSGSAVVDVPLNLTASTELAVTFDVYLGGGKGGEGLSFNVGSLPRTYFDERGAGSGLTVEFLTWLGRVDVWYDDALQVQNTVTFPLRSSSFVTVEIVHSDEGLRVIHGEHVVVTNVSLPGWAPQPSWRVGFGARTGETRDDYHLVDNLRIRTGGAYRKVEMAVEVSLNTQEWTDDR